MALTPAASWTTAFLKNRVDVRVLVTITDGTTTWKALNAPCDNFTYPVGVDSVSSISAELNPLTRETQANSYTIVFQYDYLKQIVVDNRLYGQQCTIKIGAKEIDEVDFISFGAGFIERITPIEGTHFEVECVDAYEVLLKQKVVGYWLNLNPLEIIEDIIGKTDIPSTLINSTSLDPSDSDNSSISHLQLSRGGRTYYHDFALFEPTPAADLISEINVLLNGNFVTDEDGKLKYTVFDSTASAVDHWDDNDIRDFEQLNDDEFDASVINQVQVVFGRDSNNVYVYTFERNDTDSQTNYAYPGESARVVSKKIQTEWLNNVLAGLEVALTNVGTSMVINSSQVHAFTGMRWPSYDNSHSVAQPAWAKIGASNPAYFLIEDEIVKCTTAPVVTESSHYIQIKDPADNAYKIVGPYPKRATFTIARGQLGTSNVAHAQFSTVVDVTIPVNATLSRLERFGDGMSKIKVTTDLSKLDKQIGDLVTIEHDRYVSFGVDGLVEGTGKWEILSKEADIQGSPPKITWILGFAAIGSFNESVISLERPSTQDAVRKYTIANEDVNRPCVISGLDVTVVSGRQISVGTGTAGDGIVSTQLNTAQTFTPRASKDTYVTYDVNRGALGFYETALGAGSPIFNADDVLVAKVVTDATDATVDVTDVKDTAIDGIKIVDSTITAAEINTDLEVGGAGNIVWNGGFQTASKRDTYRDV